MIATVFVMTMNLRGIRESGTAFAVPTYLFMVAILGMALWGFIRYFLGDLPPAASADLEISPEAQFSQGFTGLAAAFLLLRAFASGCAALTGVEAISNGVPAFRKPKGRNAAKTLLMLGLVAVVMGLSVNVLGNLMGVRMAEDPATQLIRADGTPVGASYEQTPVISQLAAGIFDHFRPGFFIVAAVTGLILVLAANTAFNGFPVLGSILARDGYLPRQLHTRGDRLAFSNGILLLSGFAILLIVAFDAQVTRLIQLYIVGVFVSFTVSQTGMVRHWTVLLRSETDPAERRRMHRSRAINAFGLTVTALVLVIVLVTKFTHGAWIAIAAMVVLFVVMQGIRRHYDRVGAELALEPGEELTLPSKVHAVVPVSKLHKPTLRALAFAKASRPDVLEAVTVNVDSRETARAGGRMGRARADGATEGTRVAVPRDHPPDRRLRTQHPAGQPTGHRDGVHPRVRTRTLVGAAAPQPERSPSEGSAAVHSGRDGDKRAVPAAVLRDRRTPRRATGDRAGCRSSWRRATAGRPPGPSRTRVRASLAQTRTGDSRRSVPRRLGHHDWAALARWSATRTRLAQRKEQNRRRPPRDVST